MKLLKVLFLFLAAYSFHSCEKEQEKPNLPLHNKKVLILGNSITENGKYVDFLEYYLRKNYPETSLDIISIGLSGETVSGGTEANRSVLRPCVHSRLDDALQLIKPDLVLACYGMNDGIYSEKDSARFDDYKNGVHKLIKKVKATNAELILMTPTPFDPDPIIDRVAFEDEPQSYQHPYYDYGSVLFEYSKWLKTLENIKTIDLNTYLNNQLVAIKTQKSDSTFIPDGVHPNAVGHFYMAKKILSDLYPNIQINDPTASIAPLKIDPLFLVVSNRRKIRSEGWLNYVGYTKEETVKSDDISSTIEEVKQLDSVIKETQYYTKE
ncbi:hypothetical protein EYD45_08525 [Hyunsoonleella flava]|uniref:SGNH hydrolase-type esterase domain-containing protein n=1 Tax=Hyunsoonleella flava TaxID=2527939 RepID=A0A4Q9FE37_9FLAO|nr:SGNH/GDSL hydrolase family protein [Hyunsoonleella flava]TBN04046.1 hypothetical protein EYD45_08525 [Hyunsoonleella flava]